jgi:hypothetical protein
VDDTCARVPKQMFHVQGVWRRRRCRRSGKRRERREQREASG